MNIDYLLQAHGFGGRASKDKVPPPKVIGFTVTKDGENAKMTWTNPIDTDFVGVVIVKKLKSYPTSAADGEVIYKGNGTSYTDTNVKKAEYVYYRAFSYDFDSNYNTEDGQTGRVLVKGNQAAPSAPVIEKTEYYTVTLRAYSGYEYRLANGSWQDSNIFKDLAANTTYTFYQRKKGNTYYYPSPDSAGASTKTLKPPYQTMTAVIDQNNSNPLTCITYEDDAKLMSKGSLKWDSFFDTKLVLFKGGREIRVLKDSELNSLSASDGDVMVKFKRMGLNIKTVGSKVYVTMTDNPNDPNFKYYAHTRGTAKRDAFYLGAYLGYDQGGKLRSIRNVTPTASVAYNQFRVKAQANGTGYEMMAFYQWTFLQAMFVLKYGSLDSQTALGQGYTGASAVTSTGKTNGKGIDYGTTSAQTQMRFQYVEDMWGNLFQFCDGCGTASGYFWTGTDNFNDNRSGYSKYSASGSGWFYPKTCLGSSETGFVGKDTGGSSSTYYCDYTYMNPSNGALVPYVGGYWSHGVNAGAFCFGCSYAPSSAYSSIGARLMFL